MGTVVRRNLFCEVINVKLAIGIIFCVVVIRVGFVAEQNARSAEGSPMIQQLIDAVDLEKLRNTIYDLQENFDLYPPHKPSRSRIFWRVSNSLDSSRDATDNASEYIYQKFKSFGLQVEYDQFTVKYTYPMVMEPVVHKERNVVAILPGKGPQKEKVHILCAHYDSANDSEVDMSDWNLSQGHAIWKNVPAPGANDNATGTAAVIEAARVISQGSWNYTFKFIAFTCEEFRQDGARHYVQMARERGEKIVAAINLDMIGYQPNPDKLEIRVIGPQECVPLLDAVILVGKAYNVPLEITKEIREEPGDDVSFRRKGYPAIRIAETPGYPYYHTKDDTVDKLNMQLVTQTTRLVIATLTQLVGSVK